MKLHFAIVLIINSYSIFSVSQSPANLSCRLVLAETMKRNHVSRPTPKMLFDVVAPKHLLLENDLGIGTCGVACMSAFFQVARLASNQEPYSPPELTAAALKFQKEYRYSESEGGLGFDILAANFPKFLEKAGGEAEFPNSTLILTEAAAKAFDKNTLGRLQDTPHIVRGGGVRIQNSLRSKDLDPEIDPEYRTGDILGKIVILYLIQMNKNTSDLRQHVVIVKKLPHRHDDFIEIIDFSRPRAELLEGTYLETTGEKIRVNGEIMDSYESTSYPGFEFGLLGTFSVDLPWKVKEP